MRQKKCKTCGLIQPTLRWLLDKHCNQMLWAFCPLCKKKIAKVSPARRAVVVKWAAPASNGGAAITGWVVRTYAGTKLVKSTTVRAAARSVTVAGLTPGRSYTFRVQARNVAGTGTWSGASKAVKPNR